MTAYGFPADYLLQREAVVRAMTVERIRELAAAHLDRDRFLWGSWWEMRRANYRACPRSGSPTQS